MSSILLAEITYVFHELVKMHPITGNHFIDGKIVSIILIFLTTFIFTNNVSEKIYSLFRSNKYDRIYKLSQSEILNYNKVFDNTMTEQMSYSFTNTLEYLLEYSNGEIIKQMSQLSHNNQKRTIYIVKINKEIVYYSPNTFNYTTFVAIPSHSKLSEQDFFDYLKSKCINNVIKSECFSIQKQENNCIKWTPYGAIGNKNQDSIITDSGISILNDVDNFMKNGEIYKKMCMNRKKTYLLHGPPGTGKSSIVNTISSKYQLPIYKVTFRETFICDTEYLEMLQNIKKDAIVVLDDIPREIFECKEIEQIIPETIDQAIIVRAMETRKKIEHSTLLEFMDDKDHNEFIKIVFICTNYPDSFRPEFIRPGRVDKIIECGYLNPIEIKRYFDYISRTINYEFDSNMINNLLLLSKKIDISYGLIHTTTASLIIKNEYETLVSDVIHELGLIETDSFK